MGEQERVEELARYLEEWAEADAAHLLRLHLNPQRPDEVAAWLEHGGDHEGAEQWRIEQSVAGLYLNRAALRRERASEIATEIPRIKQDIERSGAWEESYEWRIATEGSARLERVDARYRTISSFHGVFQADFRTFAEAFEAETVLSRVQKHLFYALGWSCWVSRSTMNPEDRRGGDVNDEGQYAYLAELWRAARPLALAERASAERAVASDGVWRAVERRGDIDIERAIWPDSFKDWDGSRADFLRHTTTAGSLRLAAESPTMERALEYSCVYMSLIHDLRVVLGWEWLDAAS